VSAIPWAGIVDLVGTVLAPVIAKALAGEGCAVSGCPADVRDAVLPPLTSGSAAMRKARAEARARLFPGESA
jgi:hypothetical protein